MKTKFAFVLLVSAICLGNLKAVQINFASPAFEIARTSNGTLLDNSFQFTVGSFGAFSPTGANISSWLTNFTPLQVTPTTSWDDGFTQFSQTSTLNTNSGSFATNMQAYIWGYNTQTVGTGAEWVLFTNSAWTFPDHTSLLPVTWDIAAVGTVAVFGFLSPTLGTNPYFSTAAAIPEPSTYAVILGFLALSFAAYRRRQRSQPV